MRLHRLALATSAFIFSVCVLSAKMPLDGAYPTLPPTSPVAGGWCNTDSVKEAISAMPHDNITGLWSIPGDGTEIAVTEGREGTYELTFLSPTLHAIVPGTLLGILAPTASPGHYRATLYTDRQRRTLVSPASFDVTLNDDRHLTFEERKTRVKVSVYPRLTSLFGIRLSVSTPGNLNDGLVRIYPTDTDTPPSKPMYL